MEGSKTQVDTLWPVLYQHSTDLQWWLQPALCLCVSQWAVFQSYPCEVRTKCKVRMKYFMKMWNTANNWYILVSVAIQVGMYSNSTAQQTSSTHFHVGLPVSGSTQLRWATQVLCLQCRVLYYSQKGVLTVACMEWREDMLLLHDSHTHTLPVLSFLVTLTHLRSNTIATLNLFFVIKFYTNPPCLSLCSISWWLVTICSYLYRTESVSYTVLNQGQITMLHQIYAYYLNRHTHTSSDNKFHCCVWIANAPTHTHKLTWN